MNSSAQVIHNLRILGLSAGATASDVKAAFRRLARTCHPDVAGKSSTYKFEQITIAYTYLKNLPDEEFQQEYAERQTGRARAGEERERLERERKAARARESAIDAALACGERLLGELLARAEREQTSREAQDFALRLASSAPKVRHLALSKLGALANQSEVLAAMLELLRKWDIDEKTASLVSMLPLEPENRRALAKQLVSRASLMPNLLLSYLLRLRSPHTRFDRELWEQYLQNAHSDGIVLILRHWPRDFFISENTLKHLLSARDETVLITLLCAMKQRGVPCQPWNKELLSAHLAHPSVAVRVWAKSLLPR